MRQEQLQGVVPFLKWAGGKRWLTQGYDIFPDTFSGRYIEPFLGSGAVFFTLLPRNAILSDSNRELIETYVAIKEDWYKVLNVLGKHDRYHCSEYYYRIRAQKPRNVNSRAARFIYLNRTCWNGLYRVNLGGQFNVPKGSKHRVILETDDFEAISKALRGAMLRSGDFEAIIGEATKGDFVFIDPPYTVKHNSNAFVKYNEGLFSWDDQVRLRDSVLSAARRGAKLLMTNAYHESILELYSGIGHQIVLTRSSVISGKAAARGTFEELLIKCF